MKLNSYTTPEAKLAALCRSLGHPTRVTIIKTIAQKKNCVASQIIPSGDVSEKTIAEHLRSMKKEGIIKGRLAPSSMSYCIDWKKLDEFKSLFDDLYQQVKQNETDVICNNGKCK